MDISGFYLLVVLTGCVAGFMAGLLGIGGGLLIVPVLAFLLPHVAVEQAIVMHIALGTSLASIVFTSISSVWAHHRHGAVLWPVMHRMTVGIVIGAILGALLVDQLDTRTLSIIFGCFVMIVALQMATAWRVDAHSQLPGAIQLATAGSVIGAVSSMVGIGGGTMSVPYLMWHGVDIRRAVATAAANGLPIALAGASAYAVAGYLAVGRSGWQIGYIDLSVLLLLVAGSVSLAPFGAKVAVFRLA